MKNLLALLCIAYALFISGESLMCKSCENRKGKTCESEESIECEGASKCVSVAGFIKLNSTKHPFIHKGCPTDLNDKEWLCMTSKDLDCQSYVSSCQGDNCILDYYIPDDDSTENCITCPFCYEEGNSDGCKSETQGKCRGDNTLCVEYRGRVKKPDGNQTDVSFKSCANTVGFGHFFAFYGLEEMYRKVFQLVSPSAVDLN